MIRSAEQNRLYWAIIGEAARSLNVTSDRLHEYIKSRLLCDDHTLEVGSTANLSTTEFSKFIDQAQGLIEQKKEGVQNMYDQNQQGGYNQPQYQQDQSNELFVGSGKIRQTNFGPVLKISFTETDLQKMMAHLTNGWVNVDCLQRRELGRNGQTHYLKIDTWQPNSGMQFQQQVPQNQQGQYQQRMPYQNPPQVAYMQNPPQVAYMQNPQGQYQQQRMQQPARQYPADGGYDSYQPRPRATQPAVRSNLPNGGYQPQVPASVTPPPPQVPPEPQYDDSFDPQELDQQPQTQHTAPREDIPQQRG